MLDASVKDSKNWFELCCLNFSVMIADIFVPSFIYTSYAVIPVAPSQSMLSPAFVDEPSVPLRTRNP